MILSRFWLDSFCPTMKHSKSSRWIGSILIVSVTGLSLFSCREPGPQYTGPYSPLEALETFKLPNGFRIELVASEPDVLDPVSLCFDEEGRLYVVEMRDYPRGPPAPSGRIRRLEDLDGDGRMDRSVVFADDLAFPTSVLAWNGGVLVSAAPDILYLADRDGDGQADVREVVFTGFSEVNPQHTVNGLRQGVDNWIYGANGSGDVRAGKSSWGDLEAGQSVSSNESGLWGVGGSDFRIRPESILYEPVSGRSQFSMALDDWGNRFVNTNAKHLRHPVMPLHYLQRNPALLSLELLEDISDHGSLARVFPISQIEERFNQFDHAGFTTTLCGGVVYRGGAFPAEYRGNYFVCEPLHNLVHRDVLEPAATSFVATRAHQGREFLASTDNYFRPVNQAIGPDGARYIADFYRKVIEHPFGIPNDVQKRLDFRAGDDRGRIYRVLHQDAPSGPVPRLGQASTQELVEGLESANAWWRLTCQRLILERADRSAVTQLPQLFRNSPSPLARLHALWSLEALSVLQISLLREALEDPSTGVRTHALRLAESRLDRSDALVEAVLERSTDSSIRVRFQTALTLGMFAGKSRFDVKVMEALASLAARDGGDRWFRVAIAAAAAQKEAALVDRLTADHTGFLEAGGADAIQLVRLIANAVASRAKEEQIVPFLKVLTKVAPGTPQAWRIAALAPLSRRLPRASLSKWIDKTGGRKLLDSWSTRLVREAESSPGKAESRADAIAVLEINPSPGIARRLSRLLGPQSPHQVERAVVRLMLASSKRTSSLDLLDGWSSFSAPVRDEILSQVMIEPKRASRLLDAVETGRIGVTELGTTRRRQLLDFPAEKVRNRARTLLANSPDVEREETITQLVQQLGALEGNVDRGRDVFMAECATCHNRRTNSEGILYKGKGGNVAPDLGAIRSRSRQQLLLDVLDPNREVDPRYLGYEVITTKGQVVNGVIQSETSRHLTLRNIDGSTVIPRGQIAKLCSTGVSFMPDGFELSLSGQQLSDLVEFLRKD